MVDCLFGMFKTLNLLPITVKKKNQNVQNLKEMDIFLNTCDLST